MEVGNGFHPDVNRFIPIYTTLFPTHTHIYTYLLTL